jgi:hypothetical protein
MHAALHRRHLTHLALAVAALLGAAACGGGGGTGGGTTLPTLVPSGSSFQAEGAAGTTATLLVAVDVVGSSTSAITVDWAAAPATGTPAASPGSDYVAASGTLTIPAGATSGQVAITVNGDDLDEEDESLVVTFSHPVNATLGPATTGLATILDDDAPPAVAVHDAAAVLEGSGVGGTLSFPVTLSAPSGRVVTVDYATSAGTATAPADYAAASGRITFAPGEVSREVLVTVAGDTLDEVEEDLAVVLSLPTHATLAQADAGGVGIILDDDAPPDVFMLAPTSVTEGSGGALTPVTFDLALTAASSRTVTVDWTTAAGTAAAGSDFTAASGTVTFAPGEIARQVVVTVVGDDAVEPDEAFAVMLSNTVNAGLETAGISVTILNDDAPAAGPQALNDTGVVLCGSDGGTAATRANNLTCPAAAYPDQDGDHGRDVTANDPADGAAGFSFVKLDAAGAPLADQAAAYATTPWHCVRDQVTGLTWEVKTNDGGLHDTDWYFSWYSPDAATNGGVAGTQLPANPGFTMCPGNVQCNTQKFVADVNAAGWCGASDWRLPTMDELHSLSHLGRSARPFLDAPWFPNMPASTFDATYWSSVTWAGTPASAWVYNFGVANNDGVAKSSRSVHAMLVRGRPAPAGPAHALATCQAGMTLTRPDDRYTDNGDGTVTDVVTGLMWKRCVEGMTWNGATCTGDVNVNFTWAGAIGRAASVAAAGFAGHTDWRLPNQKELLSLVEWACQHPAINPTAFPATPDEEYWTSTPGEVSSPGDARTVRFWDGSDLVTGKGIFNWVRLVRTP